MRIIGWILIVVICLWAYGAYSENKEGKEKIKTSAFVIAALIMLFVGFPMAFHHTATKVATSHHITKTEKASSSKASSKRESSKKEKAQVNKAKAKNEKENLADYKKALKSVPEKTKGAITDAYVDKDSGETMVTLSDDALGYSSNELKAVAKTAWNSIGSLRDNYTPFPDDAGSTEMYITIQDSAGNKIAHTSLLGSFKYDGD